MDRIRHARGFEDIHYWAPSPRNAKLGIMPPQRSGPIKSGSTPPTLMLGDTLYRCNVGCSWVILCPSNSLEIISLKLSDKRENFH